MDRTKQAAAITKRLAQWLIALAVVIMFYAVIVAWG